MKWRVLPRRRRPFFSPLRADPTLSACAPRALAIGAMGAHGGEPRRSRSRSSRSWARSPPSAPRRRSRRARRSRSSPRGRCCPRNVSRGGAGGARVVAREGTACSTSPRRARWPRWWRCWRASEGAARTPPRTARSRRSSPPAEVEADRRLDCNALEAFRVLATARRRVRGSRRGRRRDGRRVRVRRPRGRRGRFPRSRDRDPNLTRADPVAESALDLLCGFAAKLRDGGRLVATPSSSGARVAALAKALAPRATTKSPSAR